MLHPEIASIIFVGVEINRQKIHIILAVCIMKKEAKRVVLIRGISTEHKNEIFLPTSYPKTEKGMTG